MELEITPEPSEEERAAIAAALGLEPVDTVSPWGAAVLPGGDETG
jgi:hypothetical protein